MRVSELHPELQTLRYRLARSVPFHRPWFFALIRRLDGLSRRPPPKLDDVQVEDIALTQGSVRLYRPASGATGAGLLWIHGGGYIIGNVSISDGECVTLARELGLTVLSIDYRLAPQHPFPAALDDCFEGWELMQASAADWSLDPGRIAVAGQSAGGGLAAALVQRIHDAGGPQPAAQVLIYPMLDDRTAANAALDDIGHVLWSNRNNRAGWSHYLGTAPGGETTPQYAVPARRENLQGLPPAWMGVGELDLFLEEDRAYAQRLEASGVACTFHTTPGAPHGFDIMVPGSSPAKAFVEDYHRFLRRQLAL